MTPRWMINVKLAYNLDISLRNCKSSYSILRSKDFHVEVRKYGWNDSNIVDDNSERMITEAQNREAQIKKQE